MKKFVSLLLTVVLLATILTVFTVTASAEGEPVEVDLDIYGDDLSLNTPGNYIISSDCDIGILEIDENITLTIAKDVTVAVKKIFTNSGTLNVCGTLDIFPRLEENNNRGTVNVFGCSGGTINGPLPGNGTVSELDHYFADGKCVLCGTYECEVNGNHDWNNSVCSVCGNHCEHKWDAATGKCTICQIDCTHKYEKCDICGKVQEAAEIPPADTNPAAGSTLSDGNMTVILCVACSAACLAAGAIGMYFIMKKKKPALVSGENKDEEKFIN